LVYFVGPPASIESGPYPGVMAPSPILVFDGDCAFCTLSARWVERKWPPGTARLVPSRSLSEAELESFGLTRDDVQRAAWWISAGRRDPGHLAIARALAARGGVWGLLGRALLVPPLRWLGAPTYALVARNRHRLPGGTASCRVGP
jgi:predicted DCC family thiol-disulfide oxidoreductase YuxK